MENFIEKTGFRLAHWALDSPRRMKIMERVFLLFSLVLEPKKVYRSVKYGYFKIKRKFGFRFNLNGKYWTVRKWLWKKFGWAITIFKKLR